MNITIVYKSETDEIGDSLKGSPIFTFIDESSNKERRKAFTLKNHWGAKMTPFIICTENDKPIKAFYSESGDNVIDSLLKYLKDENISIG